MNTVVQSNATTVLLRDTLEATGEELQQIVEELDLVCTALEAPQNLVSLKNVQAVLSRVYDRAKAARQLAADAASVPVEAVQELPS